MSFDPNNFKTEMKVLMGIMSDPDATESSKQVAMSELNILITEQQKWNIIQQTPRYVQSLPTTPAIVHAPAPAGPPPIATPLRNKVASGITAKERVLRTTRMNRAD